MNPLLASVCRPPSVWIWLAALFLVSRTASAHAQTNDISLARSYPVPVLRDVLTPRAQWRPYATWKDRGPWTGLEAATRNLLVHAGEVALAKPLPSLSATLYLEYARNGNRSRYETVYFERRSLLHDLVIAECVEGKGRFLDAAANAIWSICEESTWCLPAHVSVQKAGVGLPDVLEPIVDLFAGETAVTLSWTDYLLGPELDRVSPRIRARLEGELDRRILTPVLTRDFGWMGFGAQTRAGRPNNWNPWICSSVLTAALLIESETERRAQIVHKLLRCLDCFLQPYPADGGCDEGPGYWSRAGGSLFDNLELLSSASQGKIDLFQNSLVQEIGRFVYRAHISGSYFVDLGDCPARIEIDRGLVFRFGERINDPHLKVLAAYGATAETVLASSERSLGRHLASVFTMSRLLALRPPAPPLVREVWLGSHDMQWMAARDLAGSDAGLYLAAWGGHNAQSHNHNDVGNFIVFADGRPVFVDPGAPTYTAQTFSAKRYQIWAFQSSYHNLPAINGVMQSAGAAFAARQVKCETNDASAQLTMDIAGAYPEAAKVKSWVRTARLVRGRAIEIVDAFELREMIQPSTQYLLTPLPVDSSQPGQLVLRSPVEAGRKPWLMRVAYEPAKLVPSVESLKLDDPRLANVWGGNLNRVSLKARLPALRDQWTLRIVLER
jgi:hypothetical protein